MRKYFLTGLAVLLPTILTVVIVIFLFDLFSEPFVPLVRTFLNYFSLPQEVTMFLSRLIGLVLLFFLILLLGFITRHIFLNNLIKIWNQIVYRIPFVKTIYKLSRDIFTAIFSSDEKQAFKEAAMVPFPDKPNYCVGFTTGVAPPECEQKTGQKLLSVFVPTAPHPISGFLFLVQEKNVHPIPMSKEDAFKFLFSCGMVFPEEKK